MEGEGTKRRQGTLAWSSARPESNAQSIALPKDSSVAAHCSTVGVAIVEEDSQCRHTLIHFLGDAPGFHCSGAYGNLKDARAGIIASRPSIVLTNLLLPDGCGIEFTKVLKAILPSIAVVIVSAFDLDGEMIKSFGAGASAFLVKPFHAGQFLATLRFSLGRPGPSAQLQASSDSHATKHLTKREWEVMRYFARGLLYKEIADQLHISVSAVHKHQHNIFVKLHVSNRMEAVRECERVYTWRAVSER